MEGKKITVKHYLNRRAKPKIYSRESYYPLYIQLIVYARKAQLKSRINEHLKIYQDQVEQLCNKDRDMSKLMLAGYFTAKQIDQFRTNKTFPLFHLLNDEIEVIKRIISLQKPFENSSFTLNNFSREYKLHITEITDILDSHIKQRYRETLNEIFLKTLDKSAEKKVFNISNYFIHYLNWDNDFYNFYELTYEVIPSELKYLENFLDKELLTSIKAYLAYHSKINVLKRYLEKKEHGRISTVSYLDWITEIKDFILKEFIKIFGRKKGTEYVDSLDSILVRTIKG